MLSGLHQISNQSDFLSALYNFLVGQEDPVRTVYLDNAPSRVPTIGVGFNLRATDSLTAVVRAFGVDPLSESNVVSQLAVVFNSTVLSATQMQSQADGIMQANGRSIGFRFSEGAAGLTEMRNLFIGAQNTPGLGLKGDGSIFYSWAGRRKRNWKQNDARGRRNKSAPIFRPLFCRLGFNM